MPAGSTTLTSGAPVFVISILAVIACVLVALLPLVGRNQSGSTVMDERAERLRARKAANASVLPLAPQAAAPAEERRAA